MGKTFTKTKDNIFADLKKRTKLTEKELKDLYNEFNKDYPDGRLNMEQFQNVYRRFFPKGDARTFAIQIFSTFDSNGDGFIDFREFMVGLSDFKKGNVNEKLSWAFSMYDLDKNGEISREEMLEVVRGIYKMLGDTVILPESESTPEKRVDKIFSTLDKNNDGKVTLDEFLEYAENNAAIQNLLQSN